MAARNNLRHYRLLAGLTQEEVARQLGLKSSNRLSRWEAGKACPSVANALRLARLYGATVEDLYKS